MALYAHSREDVPLSGWQTLEEHLNNVARLTAGFASAFDCPNWGRAVGVLHDAGKASDAFQRRIQGSFEHVDHSTAGAKEAQTFNSKEQGDYFGNLMSFVVAGHHGGLPNGLDPMEHGRTLDERLKSDDVPSYEMFKDLISEERVNLPSIKELENYPALKYALDCSKSGERFNRKLFSFGTAFFTRMLFSCLVDADYLDTERFISPDKNEARNRGYAAPTELLGMLEEFIAKLQSHAEDTPVNAARRMVMDDARVASSGDIGLYTMTVPTGGGKTLASTLFALKHAVEHNLQRVIVAIPFTSIVEQTAAVLKSVFGNENVLEHHSNYDFEARDGDTALSERLAVQNWDAPIIVTTNVQLLESLYANKPGKCRKLHNVANSVIVLDEAQTIPDALLKPSLAALEELALNYKCSVVLCTATQPAISDLWPFGGKTTEIVVHSESFEAVFGSRVSYQKIGETTKESLANDLLNHNQVLCIVGTKAKARDLFNHCIVQAEDGADGIFHLSASMVPNHRSAVIAEVTQRLSAGQRCVVVSTQLIEAGVDVDFPCVYREVAGIDSIVQAAGRCNRSGIRKNAEGVLVPGEVKVFTLQEDRDGRVRVNWLEKMKSITRELFETYEDVSPDNLVNQFFIRRYQTTDLDEKRILSDICSLRPAYLALEYERYAHDFEIIDDDTVPLFIPWGEEGSSLLRKLQASDEPARMAMLLQRYSVSVRPYVFEQLERDHAIEHYGPIHVVNDACRNYYSEEIGLVEPGKEENLALVL